MMMHSHCIHMCIGTYTTMFVISCLLHIWTVHDVIPHDIMNIHQLFQDIPRQIRRAQNSGIQAAVNRTNQHQIVQHHQHQQSAVRTQELYSWYPNSSTSRCRQVRTIRVQGPNLGTVFEEIFSHGTRHALVRKTTCDRIMLRDARGFVLAF